MPDQYLSHISSDQREQTVLGHLEGTARLAQHFASRFQAGEQGRLVGLAHDIGKYSAAFQRRLHGDRRRVDHSTAGAVECCRLGMYYSAQAVAAHHGGLQDYGTETDTEDTFRGRIKNCQNGAALEPYDNWKEELSLTAAAAPVMESAEEEMFFTRMLYSCLVDADYLDTEAFMSGAPRPACEYDMVDLLDRLCAYIAPWFPPRNELNEKRCAILNQCLCEGKRQTPGLFTLTVPTGGGKTVSSLAFALAHAKARGLDRVIYVIPYTSIIDQTAKEFRKILGAENVLEHHSGVLYDIKEESTPEEVRLAKATENWDMPVVVTTAIQFFESLFASRSSQCRKLHNLAKSVIIFDEAQMLPLSYLRPCVFAIAQLVKHYGASAVLCTATQPSLGELFREYLPYMTPRELCPPSVCQWEDFRRVTFHNAGKLSWEDVATALNSHKQVLCIVNTRKSAQTLFHLLDQEGSYHLSTLMCPVHRQAQLEEIRIRLQGGLPCRVVSTSLIEAGVDVDFPVLFREEAGLDSILQAAGRCNREGKRKTEESIVTLFQGPDPAPILFRTNIDTARPLIKKGLDPADPKTIRCYFNDLIYLKGNDALDSQCIMANSQKMRFRTISQRFHLIDNATRTVYVPLNEEANCLIAQLREGLYSRELFRKLGRYGVNIYDRQFDSLDMAGALERLEDGSAILVHPSLYDRATGLSTHAESGEAVFL